MAFARTAIHPRDLSAPVTRNRPSFWRRFFAAMIESRQRQAEREITRLIDYRGGKFTDEAEREMERILAGGHY